MADDILTALLDEQRKTNDLLVMLIDALGEEQQEGEQIARYLDGSPAHD